MQSTNKDTMKPFHLWIDLETTGLNERARGAMILEVAAVTTTVDTLEIVATSTHVLYLSPRRAGALDPFIRKMHEGSGLLDACANASRDLKLSQVLCQIESDLGLLQDSTERARELAAGKNTRPVLCGNTIGFDRRWLDFHAPGWLAVNAHYRSIDVSTVKELARHWAPEVVQFWETRHPKEKAPHRALADVKQSIAELRYYRQTMFQGSEGGGDKPFPWSTGEMARFAEIAERVKS